MTGAKIFAETMLTEVGKHIYTGMSYGSLVPMGRQVRAMMDGSAGESKWIYTNINTGKKVNDWKSWSVGIRLGQKAFHLVVGNKRLPVFKLRFYYTVYQHKFHDIRWQSLEKAKAAFMEYMLRSKARLMPQFRDYMETKISTVRR